MQNNVSGIGYFFFFYFSFGELFFLRNCEFSLASSFKIFREF